MLAMRGYDREMASTITIELDDDAAHMLWYSAHERAGGDVALALRQALDA